MGHTIDCFCKGTEFTQSHRPKDTILILTTNLNQTQDTGLSLVHTCRKNRGFSLSGVCE